MKIKSIVKSLILIAVVAAAVIAFFSYDVVESVTVADDIPHIQNISHVMKDNKTVELTISDTVMNVSDDVNKVKILIHQNQLKSTASYDIKNMKAVISLPKDVIIVSAICNDANERFPPKTSYLGNKLEVICSGTSDYLDVELVIQGNITFDPEVNLSYDLYGKGFRMLSRFLSQQQQLTITLQDDAVDAKR